MTTGLLPPHVRGHADRYRHLNYWSAEPVPNRVDHGMQAHPDRAAIIDRIGSLSYAQLAFQVRRAAAGLLEIGIRPGDAVALQLPNWREFAVLQQACARIGAASIPLIPQLRAADLHYILSISKATALVVPQVWRGFNHATMAMQLRDNVPALREVIVAGGPAPAGAIEFDGFMETPWEEIGGAAVDAITVSRDAIRTIIFTSGTESRPKGVLHSFNTGQFPLARHRERLQLRDDEVIFTPSPVGHGTGALFGVELALSLGGTVVLEQSWEAARAVETVARHQCTMMWGATTFYTDFVRSPELRRHDISSFRLLCSAGAPIPRDLLLEVKDKTKGRLISAYGQSEGGNMAIVGVDDPEDKALSSDGRVNADLDFKLVDADGKPAPPDAPGEFLYRGPGLCLGYLDSENTRAAIDADGFIHSGDVVTVDKEGFLRVVGRRKEIIIRGGENISPAEVEHALYMHPKIAEVSVVGIADKRLGQMSCAVVVPQPGANVTLADLTAHMDQQQIAKFKWPELLVMMDQLPRTATGKVRRDALRQIVEAARQP